MISKAITALCSQQFFKSLCPHSYTHEDALHKKFDNHIDSFGLSFGTQEEYEYRFNLFAEKDRLIEEVNAEQRSFTVGHNQFSTLSDAEYSKWLNGSVKQNVGIGEPCVDCAPKQEDGFELPDSIDWRGKGVIPPVHSQGMCDPASALAEFDSIEAQLAINRGEMEQLAFEQYLECQDVGKYCQGHVGMSVYAYAKDYGFEDSKDYPHSSKKECHFEQSKVKVKVDKVVKVDENVQAIKEALVNGPVHVLVEADKLVFQAYAGGILSSDRCGTQLNHSLLAVGYGKMSGVDYFLMKNSWGASWGDHGYIKIAAAEGKGICGMNQEVHYPVVIKL